eukprot:scaffold215885_cov24-Tisochrysis_lutea.AAC.2
MERASPPSLAAAALAAMDEAIMMDTPLSRKRPRQDDPPDRWRAQEPAGHAGAPPRTARQQRLRVFPSGSSWLRAVPGVAVE